MDLKYKILSHPFELISRGDTKLREWLDTVVSTQTTTLEIPITEDIFYPISVFVNPEINGVSRLMMIKAAFYFYLEADVDVDFLESVGIPVDINKKCWYEYVDINLREIKSIEKIDEDEFMLVSQCEIKPPTRKQNPEHISVLCKSCYWMVGVKGTNIQLFFEGKYKCERCKNILKDVSRKGHY